MPLCDCTTTETILSTHTILVEQVTETLVSQLGSIDTTKITETADKAQTAVSNISSTASSIATSASSIMEVLNLFKQQ